MSQQEQQGVTADELVVDDTDNDIEVPLTESDEDLIDHVVDNSWEDTQERGGQVVLSSVREIDGRDYQVTVTIEMTPIQVEPEIN